MFRGGNGNFHFPSISHGNLSISLKFPPKNYGEILVFSDVGADSPPPPPRLDRVKLVQVAEDDCMAQFRFQKGDLPRLMNV